MTTKKPQRFTKWRVSDVVWAGLDARDAEAYASRAAAEAGLRRDVRNEIQLLDITIPLAVGFTGGPARWRALTHEQRCDLIVAEARRLNVPMRAR